MKKIINKTWKWAKIFRSADSVYSTAEFHHLIRYEKARADREGSSFSVVVFNSVSLEDSDARRLTGILKKNIRETDHIGWLTPGKLAVILPTTSHQRAKAFAEKVESLDVQINQSHSYYIYAYPEFRLLPDEYEEEELHAMIWNGIRPQNLEIDIPNRDRKAFRKLVLTKIPLWKRGLDILGSVLMLSLSLPFMLITAALIKIVSPGPIFYKQKRVGLNGKIFDFYKFRTMHHNNNENHHSQHAKDFIRSGGVMTKLDSADPRIIPFGKIIRKLCIDELPQIINILLGDMSLVGPRPCITYEAEEYLRWHKSRFNILPGLTGLWQVSGKNKLSFQQMIRLDISYGRNMTIWNDVKIIFMTIPAIWEMLLEGVQRKKAEALEMKEPDSQAV
jgi:lipopolysaccharide/colanic/teichoic acid biosynthesis glycosyltransferase